MDDRVLFVCHAGPEDIAPAVYGHWSGDEALELLATAAPVMRKDDPGYAAARLCGVIHSAVAPARTGLGLCAAPADLDKPTLCEFSAGDAGVIAVDVRDGSWQCFGGYLLSDDPRCPNPLALEE